MNFDKLCNSILERVFHGTPHDVIGSFSLNKIGSGEGAQVYGWGLYFAENPKVADSYRKNVTHKDFINKVAEVYDEYSSPEEANDALESAGLNANQMASWNTQQTTLHAAQTTTASEAVLGPEIPQHVGRPCQ